MTKSKDLIFETEIRFRQIKKCLMYCDSDYFSIKEIFDLHPFDEDEFELNTGELHKYISKALDIIMDISSGNIYTDLTKVSQTVSELFDIYSNRFREKVIDLFDKKKKRKGMKSWRLLLIHV